PELRSRGSRPAPGPRPAARQARRLAGLGLLPPSALLPADPPAAARSRGQGAAVGEAARVPALARESELRRAVRRGAPADRRGAPAHRPRAALVPRRVLALPVAVDAGGVGSRRAQRRRARRAHPGLAPQAALLRRAARDGDLHRVERAAARL